MLSRTAERLEAALSGGPVHPSVASDVEMADTVRGLTVDVRPRPEFVALLREQLEGEARQLASGSGRAGASVLRLRRPRVARPWRVAGIAAAVLVVAAALSVSSRNALPGQPLYSLREGLERATVALSFTDRARGVTLLGQAEHHLSDAVTLADAFSPAADIAVALDRSTETTRAGAEALVADFSSTRDGSSLVELRRFAERAYPVADHLTAVLPPGLTASATALRDTLAQVRLDALQGLASCDTCGADGSDARSVLGTDLAPSSATATATATATTSESGATSAPSGTSGTTAAPGSTPPASNPAGSGTTAPGAATSPGVRLPVTPSLPVRSIPSVPLPSVPSVPSVPLPSVSVSIPVPTLSVPATVGRSSCVLVVCP